MKCHVAVRLEALDASTFSFLADVTNKLPPGWWDVLDRVYRFQKYGISETNFWNPQGTSYMRPTIVISFFESTVLVWAQNTVNRSRG